MLVEAAGHPVSLFCPCQAYWANPFGWVTRALAINEFTAGHWQKPNPANPSSSLGDDVLGFR